jgi:hypothetical protein
MIITYKFSDMKEQRDAFLLMMDFSHYGMYSESLQIGPFNMAEFAKGIWVRGTVADLKEFVADFEAELGMEIYTKKVEEGSQG